MMYASFDHKSIKKKEFKKIEKFENKKKSHHKEIERFSEKHYNQGMQKNTTNIIIYNKDIPALDTKLSDITATKTAKNLQYLNRLKIPMYGGWQAINKGSISRTNPDGTTFRLDFRDGTYIPVIRRDTEMRVFFPIQGDVVFKTYKNIRGIFPPKDKNKVLDLDEAKTVGGKSSNKLIKTTEGNMWYTDVKLTELLKNRTEDNAKVLVIWHSVIDKERLSNGRPKKNFNGYLWSENSDTYKNLNLTTMNAVSAADELRQRRYAKELLHNRNVRMFLLKDQNMGVCSIQ